MILKILLPLPSMNRYAHAGTHWLLAEDKKKWKEHIMVAHAFRQNRTHDISQVLPRWVKEKRKVKVTCYRYRLLDPDNQSVKALLDSLVSLGFLYDDSNQWLNLCKIEQVKISKKDDVQHTVVEISKIV